MCGFCIYGGVFCTVLVKNNKVRTCFGMAFALPFGAPLFGANEQMRKKP